MPFKCLLLPTDLLGIPPRVPSCSDLVPNLGMAPSYRLCKMPYAAPNKRPKQLVSAETTEDEKIEMATRVYAEASVSLAGTLIVTFPLATRACTHTATVLVQRNI